MTNRVTISPNGTYIMSLIAEPYRLIVFNAYDHTKVSSREIPNPNYGS